MSQPALSPKISELLVSHICHDLVSPVGAINNGIEFIEEMGSSAVKDSMDLISSSCNQAAARLQCFRLCYGAAGSGGNVTYKDIRTVFENYIAGSRTVLNWDIDGPNSMYPEGYMKVVLNVLMLADAGIPAIGNLKISNHENGVEIVASGDKVDFKEGVMSAYRKETSEQDLNPRTVHAYLTRVFADFYQIKLDMTDKTPEKVRFTVGF